MGTNPATYLDKEQLSNKKGPYDRASRRAQVAAVHCSSGAMDTLNNYNDNDQTHGLVTAKHNDPQAVTLRGGRTNEWKPKAF